MAGPIADIVLLRGLFGGDKPLTVGSVVAARVLDHQTLLLAGVRIPARIPAELAAGEAIRVQVQEVSTERFVLQVLPSPPPELAAGTPTAAYALALPGGAQARVHVDPEGSAEAGPGGAARRSITLRFDSPALGRLDFAIDLDAGAVASTVHVTAGDPAAAARAAAPELEAGLSAATSRPASVTVRERGETLDVRA